MIKLNSIRKGLTQLKHVNISSILLSLLLLLLSACSVGNEEDKQKVEKDLKDLVEESSLTFNSEAEKNSPIYMDDYTIFSIFTHEASDAWEPNLYTLSEGELVQIESGALGHLLTTRLKAVDTDKLQTVSYNNEGEENDFG